jgi:hypothetical protein
VQIGEAPGKKRPPGELLPMDQVELRLVAYLPWPQGPSLTGMSFRDGQEDFMATPGSLPD